MFNFIRSIEPASIMPVGQIEIGLFFLQVLLLLSSVFLILLILVQRGKGGGLTGALGGMGGQSAFGSKAGDAFTKITVITALVWITLCMVTIARYNPPPRAVQKATPGAAMTSGSQEDTDSSMSSSDDGSGTTDIKTDETESGQAEGSDTSSADTSNDIQLDLDAPAEPSGDAAPAESSESTESK
jgi:preprotein translocase subunit SecG